MKYLCDSNVLNEAMKRLPDPKVRKWLSDQELVCLSVIMVKEIYFGLAYKDAPRQREWFEKLFCFRSKILPVTLSIVKRCGTLHGNFRKKGIIRTQADILIVATAVEHDQILAIRNFCNFGDCGIQLFNPFED